MTCKIIWKELDIARKNLTRTVCSLLLDIARQEELETWQVILPSGRVIL